MILIKHCLNMITYKINRFIQNIKQNLFEK